MKNIILKPVITTRPVVKGVKTFFEGTVTTRDTVYVNFGLCTTRYKAIKKAKSLIKRLGLVEEGMFEVVDLSNFA